MQQHQPPLAYQPNRPPKWLWVLPVVSCGFLSLVPPITIAAKARSSRVWQWTGVLVVTWFIGFAMVGSQPEDSDNFWTNAGVLFYLAAWIGSIVFALALGPKVSWSQQASYVPVAPPTPFVHDPNQAAVAAIQERRRKQAEARALAGRDPHMARDLRIGRPDLPRHYDDGGLVDVNSAPVEVMAKWLGLTPAQADQIAGARHQLGRFEQVEDLLNMAGLEPTAYDRVKDLVIVM